MNKRNCFIKWLLGFLINIIYITPCLHAQNRYISIDGKDSLVSEKRDYYELVTVKVGGGYIYTHHNSFSFQYDDKDGILPSVDESKERGIYDSYSLITLDFRGSYKDKHMFGVLFLFSGGDRQRHQFSFNYGRVWFSEEKPLRHLILEGGLSYINSSLHFSTDTKKRVQLDTDALGYNINALICLPITYNFGFFIRSGCIVPLVNFKSNLRFTEHSRTEEVPSVRINSDSFELTPQNSNIFRHSFYFNFGFTLLME